MNNRFIELKKQLGKFIANFSNVVEQDGKSYIYDDLSEGSVVSTYDEKGDVIPLETGTYKIGESEIYVVDGKVSQKPVEQDPDPKNDPQNPPVNDPQPQNDPVDDKDTTIANLTAEIETLKAERDAMKAELETIRKQPLADPVPQITPPSTPKDNDDIKGTKYEAACRVFGSK